MLWLALLSLLAIASGQPNASNCYNRSGVVCSGAADCINTVCQCRDYSHYEANGLASAKVERPECLYNVRQASTPGLFDVYQYLTGAWCILIVLLTLRGFLGLKRLGKLRINIQSSAFFALFVYSALNVIYYFVDPLRTKGTWGVFTDDFLSSFPDPFLASAYNLLTMYLRDLVGTHQSLQRANRFAGKGAVAVMSVSIGILLIASVVKAFTKSPEFYFGFYVLYLLVFSTFFLVYCCRLRKLLTEHGPHTTARYALQETAGKKTVHPEEQAPASTNKLAKALSPSLRTGPRLAGRKESKQESFHHAPSAAAPHSTAAASGQTQTQIQTVVHVVAVNPRRATLASSNSPVPAPGLPGLVRTQSIAPPQPPQPHQQTTQRPSKRTAFTDRIARLAVWNSICCQGIVASLLAIFGITYGSENLTADTVLITFIFTRCFAQSWACLLIYTFWPRAENSGKVQPMSKTTPAEGSQGPMSQQKPGHMAPANTKHSPIAWRERESQLSRAAPAPPASYGSNPGQFNNNHPNPNANAANATGGAGNAHANAVISLSVVRESKETREKGRSEGSSKKDSNSNNGIKPAAAERPPAPSNAAVQIVTSV